MLVPAKPTDEAKRLKALYDLLILDTPPEERFDKSVAFAAADSDPGPGEYSRSGQQWSGRAVIDMLTELGSRKAARAL